MRLRVIAGFVLFSSVAPAISLHAQSPVSPRRPFQYFVAEGIPRSGYKSGDADLVRWAFRAWEKESAGAFSFEEIPDESRAAVALYWVPPAHGVLASTTSSGSLVTRRRVVIYIQPFNEHSRGPLTDRARQDPLFRDVVVYFLCLHEIGHALGLEHSRVAGAVMEDGAHEESLPTFTRYRALVTTRQDLQTRRWLAADDIARLRVLYPTK